MRAQTPIAAETVSPAAVQHENARKLNCNDDTRQRTDAAEQRFVMREWIVVWRRKGETNERRTTPFLSRYMADHYAERLSYDPSVCDVEVRDANTGASVADGTRVYVSKTGQEMTERGTREHQLFDKDTSRR